MKFFLTAFVLLFFISCQKELKDRKIAIQPIAYKNKQVLNALQHSLSKDLSLEVILLKNIVMPKSAFTNSKSPRYRADSLIRFLKRNKADSLDYIVGFTSKDISTTKKDKYGQVKQPATRYQDWGIFGLGYRPGPSCIVSNFRLKSKNKVLSLERYKKVCLHEVGHNLGLKHCPNKECVMTDACESIKTVDNVQRSFCKKCSNRIQ